MIDGIAERILQPLSRRGIADVDLEHRRQSGQEDPAELRIAGHVSADQPREFTSPAELGQHPSFREDLSELSGRCPPV